jgi:chemotaxis protein MotB
MRPDRRLLLLPLLLILTGCSELRDLRERSVIQQRELTRLRDDLTRWQDSYYELHGQYEELGQRVQSEYRVQLRDLQAENERLRSGQSDAEAQLQDQVDTLSEETERQRTQVSALQSQLAQAQSDGQALLTRLSESESTRTGLQSRVSEMQGDLETVGEIADSMESLRAQLRQRETEVTTLRNQLLEQRDSGGGVVFGDAALERIATYLEETAESAGGPQPTIHRDPQRGVIVTFGSDDLFETGSTAVTDAARRSLTAVGFGLVNLSETSVEVIGHTDNQPLRNMPFRDNLQLSALRAENVLRILLEDGEVPGSRCRLSAAGEHHPAESNSTSEGRRANRRVEIVVVPDQGS